jgi:hypothetical protein
VITKDQVLDHAIKQQEQLAAEVGRPRSDGPRRGRPLGSKNKPKDGKGKGGGLSELTPERKLEMTRGMIEGGFMMLAAGLGPHWKMDAKDSEALARVWLPVLDYYDLEPGIGVLIFNASALTVGMVGPRIQVTVQRKTGLWGKVSDWWARRKAARKAKRQG